MIVGFHLLTCPCKSLLSIAICMLGVSTAENTSMCGLSVKQDDCLDVGDQLLQVVVCLLYGAFFAGGTMMISFAHLMLSSIAV